MERGDPYRLVTDVPSIALVLDNPDALQSRFALYGQSGLVFATDGSTITDGEDFAGNKVGDAFARPKTLKGWKDASKNGRAPSPEITIRARIKGLETLGIFRYRTGAWSLVPDLPAVEQQLDNATAVAGPIELTLSLKEVSWVDKMTQEERSYTRPYLTVGGAA